LNPSSQLAELQGQFRAVSQRAEAVAARIGENRLTQRPSPEKWSVAECLIHLAMTTEAFLPRWAEAFAQARTAELTASDRPYKMDFWGRLLAWSLEPPPRFRMPTTPDFVPNFAGPADQALPRFLDSQNRLLGILTDANGLAIDKVKIVSPFSRNVRYNVWSSFCVSAAHHRRHLWQAERVADVLADK
jgi:hypothetical protein